MKVNIEGSWRDLLRNEFDQPYFHQLAEFVRSEYNSQKVFPPGSQIFQAFEASPVDNIKVVILGQDPYHGPNQAHGLCFSVNEGVPIPPSLVNIFKEIQNDLGKSPPTNGNLSRWAQQGVLLLNATLTVRKGSPGSHQNQGWETFTDAVIKNISDTHEHIVFMLWGAYAQNKGAVINRTRHLVLASPHPSPFSAHRGFLGNKHFSKCNAYLEKQGKSAIEW